MDKEMCGRILPGTLSDSVPPFCNSPTRVPSPVSLHLVVYLILKLPSRSKRSLIPLLFDHLHDKF